MARIGPGVRNKSRILQDTCADCGATDPGWASINRGVLICDGCCSVHRSLGRHISQVKSLRKSLWHSSQLNMVQTLNSSGANHIWEHTLLDPSTAKGVRRKPQPTDPVHPNKADFIRAKHQLMSFVYRANRDENLASGDKDVSRQLHASVRTSNLETSLRLLSLGADPNYYSTEKGNCPIHVAVTAGQSCQVELLVTYGADPGALDKDGLTPVDYAREGGFTDIADRLVELQHELSDRLAFYLCNKKPDHKNGQHWIIPELADSPTEISDVAKEAKSRLIALPHHSFEELACDVYDEVDRRETDTIWLSLQNQSALLSDRCSVPFLPVNPEYSSTRNQGRQKLARFNAREFATLIIDILVEARRRMAGTQYQITDKICVDESSHSDSLLLLDSYPSSNFPLTSSPITPDHSCPNLVSGPVAVDSIERCASYDEVYVTSDEEGESSSQGFEDSVESEIGEEEEFYELEDEKSGEGCMSDLLSGMQPLIGSGKKKKKKKKTRSCYFGNDSLGLSPSRHSSATTFSLQVSKHLKEKLLNTRYAMSFGDYHPKKLSIVHPPLRCDNISPSVSSVSTPARSFFVRTFTLPLKLANQKHQYILSRNLSRSQPTSPVVSRKHTSNTSTPHTLSSLNTHLIPLTYHRSDKKHKNKTPQLMSNNVIKEISQHNATTLSHGNKNNTLKPIQLQGKNNQNVPPPSPSLNHQTSSPPNYPLKLDTNETYPYFPMDNVDLEPCKKCAYNVAANIQHVSFWKNLAASNSNLDYGSPAAAAAQNTCTSTDIKLEPSLDYFKTSEIKQNKDDCKLQ